MLICNPQPFSESKVFELFINEEIDKSQIQTKNDVILTL